MIVSEDVKRLLDGMTLPVMILDTDFRFRYVNDAYLKTVQREAHDIVGTYVFDAFPETPERIESVMEPWRRTLQGEATTLDAIPFHIEQPDGSTEERVWEATQEPVRDASGNIVGLIQRTQDITEKYALEQRNAAIGYELSHRVKNIMAVVSSVARITGRNAADVPSFVTSFTARLNAMSRTNDLLAEEGWQGLDVGTILKDELSPFEDTDKPAYTLSGPKVRLSVDATKDLSMVCHELATNAVKYGCLKTPEGRVDVSWERSGDQLSIHWKETCAHRVKASNSVGFGTRLFDMLPYATVIRDFTQSGLHLTITMDGEKVFA